MWFTEHGDYLKIYRVIYSISTLDLLQTSEQTLRQSSDQIILQTPTISRTRVSSVDSTHVGTLGEGHNLLSLRRKRSFQHRPSTPEVLRLIEGPETLTSTNDVQPSSSSIAAVNHQEIRRKKSFDRPIYLSSKIFVAQRKTQTISELRDQIQDWYNALEKGKISCLNNQILMQGRK